MAQFVNSIKSLADKKADIKEAMDIFSEVGGVMIHMQNVNQVFIEMVNNIKSLVTQLGVLKTALNGISVNASGNFTTNLKAVSDSILLPQGDVTAFVDSTNSVAKVLNAAATVTTEKVNISKDFIREISTISNSQSVTNNNTTKQGQPNIQVQVFLDSKEIASKIKTNTGNKPASNLMNGVNAD
jgi:ABC-type Fe2+-enterobactin transport system substrate-binding protein